MLICKINNCDNYKKFKKDTVQVVVHHRSLRIGAIMISVLLSFQCMEIELFEVINLYETNFPPLTL